MSIKLVEVEIIERIAFSFCLDDFNAEKKVQQLFSGLLVDINLSIFSAREKCISVYFTINWIVVGELIAFRAADER
jgi:hypothetical protein